MLPSESSIGSETMDHLNLNRNRPRVLALLSFYNDFESESPTSSDRPRKRILEQLSKTRDQGLIAGWLRNSIRVSINQSQRHGRPLGRVVESFVSLW